MMRSMYSGVAGLKTHQTKMDVIGNNIANVNTVAYKSQSVTFSELMYQTTQSASGPNATTGTGGVNARQIGLGVKSGAINTNISSQGASQTTNNPFDIMITGDAFFVVSNGQENFFTRDGSFYVDGGGNLAMTSNGYNVMGWGVDPETMDIKQDTVQALRIMAPENLTYPPEATSKAYLSGIIDKNDTNVTSSSGKNINLQIYDDLGYSYTARLNMKSTDNEGVYSLSLSAILDENNEALKGLEGINDLFGDGKRAKRTQEISLAQGYSWNANGDLLDADGVTVVCSANDLKTSSPGAEVKAKQDKVAKAYGYSSIEELKNVFVTVNERDNAGKVTGTKSGSVYDLITNKDGLADKLAAEQSYLATQNTGQATTIAKEAALKAFTSDEQGFTGYLVKFDPTTGVFKSVNDNNNVQVVNLNLAKILTGTDSKFENVEIDLSTTNMYNNSGSSTIAATSGDKDGLGTGRKLGEMSGISIQQNGMIYASYDNGQTKLLGQIAVAEFANASGL
ncbi:MAG: flagellar hook-basal body complex protein, partial [Lachnospiraceae bacterium]|nr:flagellar hook-basal body complex protein [Lachnospiraceae bacterium]